MSSIINTIIILFGGMCMLGFSIYLSAAVTEEVKQQIDLYKTSGFHGVFTSLNLPEDDPEVLLDRLGELGAKCQSRQLELTVDVSQQALERLDLSLEHLSEITELGVTRLRIDDGLAMEQVAQLSHEIPLALNASTLSVENVDELRKNQADFSQIEAWHNFYPRKNTGLDETWFRRRNAWLQAQGFRVTAFAPGNELRGPVFAGLPTLESGRTKHPLVAAIDLLRLNTNNVYIGDAGVHLTTLIQFVNYFDQQIVMVHVKPNGDVPKYLFNNRLWHQRPDVARDVVRIEEARHVKRPAIYPENTELRSRGAVTLDNQDAGRYEGELELVKRELPADQTVNVIGHVVQRDLDLLEVCGVGQTIQLAWS